MPSVLPFFTGGRALRRYRAQLQQALRAEPALRLMPDLLALPLGPAPLPDPAAILAAPTSLGLAAGPAGGRTLALLQVLSRCAEGAGPPAIYLPLAEHDQVNLHPRAVVQAAIVSAGLPHSLFGAGRPCVLLIDDYERLNLNRRTAWRSFVAGLAESAPAARAVVALPAGESWPELAELRLAVPDDATLAEWLARLLPDQAPAPIIAALAAEPLTALRDSLADLLLLALTYPISGLPPSRASLYEQAYALVRPMLEVDEEGGVEVAPRHAMIGRAALRHYRLARGLAGGHDLDTLADLPPHELAAVAPLAAGLLDDPRPVLDLLWAKAAHPAALRGLSDCLRERPAAAPADGVRLLDLLAAPGAPAEAAALLPGLSVVAPAILVAAEPGPAVATLAALDRAGVGPALPLAVVDHAGATPELRWAAADLLARGAEAAPLLSLPDGLDTLARAARCYAVALGAPAARASLGDPGQRAGLRALLTDQGGEARRRAVVGALLNDPATPAELQALALAAAPTVAAADRALVERAAADPTPGVRRAALSVLAAGDPDAALASLAQTLARDAADSEAACDALDAVAALPQTRAAALLGRSVIGEQLGLEARLHAAALLAGRGREGAAVLLRLLEVTRMAAPLRAAVARHLGRIGVGSAVAPLRAVLLADEPPLVRRAAAAALGDLARFAACRDGALAGLLAALDRPWLEVDLAVALARALAVCGPAAMPALGDLLAPALAEDLRADWLALVPELEQAPVESWPGLAMPEVARVALHEAMAVGATPADRPGGVVELADRQAAAVACVAADALAELARRYPSLRREAAMLLRRALRVGRPPELLAHALDRLGDLLGDNPVALDALLDGLAESPQLRWLALDRLGLRPAGADALVRRLQAGRDDGFTRAKIVALLGRRRELAALPALRQIAEGNDVELHLRRCATTALGNLDEPAATAALLRLVADGYTPGNVRAAAAAALPSDLDASACRLLREQVRAERPLAELATAVLAALGRAGDREALPLLMRYAQSDRPGEALAAIEALAALGDANIAPALVRVTQTASATPGVRLAAVIALLRLCGDEYLPLLRSYLESPALPLRLRAHAALAELDPDDPRLVAPLVDTAAPLALRLEALNRLLARGADDDVLPLLLANPDEEPQLRLLTATALGHAAHPRAAASLAAILASQEAPLLRRRCIDSLATLAAGAGPAAGPARRALATIAADAAAPPEHKLWAGEALLTYAQP